MKSYVIAVKNIEKSVLAAQKCIKSAKDISNIDVEIFNAITPLDDMSKILKENSIQVRSFDERYSRKENAIACFLSHFLLWKKCIELQEPVLIFEHDAVVKTKIDLKMKFDKLVSIGKPSYGRFNTPASNGLNKLTSKRYLPGAHAYIISPIGATELIKRAKIDAKPVDVFLHLDTFPWLQEYYPWPVVVEDTFSTVQKVEGCLAKHTYNSKFEII